MNLPRKITVLFVVLVHLIITIHATSCEKQDDFSPMVLTDQEFIVGDWAVDFILMFDLEEKRYGVDSSSFSKNIFHFEEEVFTFKQESFNYSIGEGNRLLVENLTMYYSIITPIKMRLTTNLEIDSLNHPKRYITYFVKRLD